MLMNLIMVPKIIFTALTYFLYDASIPVQRGRSSGRTKWTCIFLVILVTQIRSEAEFDSKEQITSDVGSRTEFEHGQDSSA